MHMTNTQKLNTTEMLSHKPTPQQANRRNRKAGFSLLEIVLVMAIIGVLLAVVAFNVVGFGERGRIRATEASMRTIKTALDTYYLEYSTYPPTIETLQTVRPPMLDTGTTLRDGWNMPFHYTPGMNSQGQPYTLISFGGSPEWDPETGINVWTVGQK